MDANSLREMIDLTSLRRDMEGFEEEVEFDNWLACKYFLQFIATVTMSFMFTIYLPLYSGHFFTLKQLNSCVILLETFVCCCILWLFRKEIHLKDFLVLMCCGCKCCKCCKRKKKDDRNEALTEEILSTRARGESESFQLEVEESQNLDHLDDMFEKASSVASRISLTQGNFIIQPKLIKKMRKYMARGQFMILAFMVMLAIGDSVIGP